MTRPHLLLIYVLSVLSAQLTAQEPLHTQIDALLQAESPLTQPPLADDAEFLRRTWLDLAGVPPTADVARSFLADQSPDKRARLIDQLMTTPLFERHLAETLDVMLMERRGNANVTQDEWMAWVIQSVRENKPWNQLAREILTADGLNGTRATARFYLDRGSEPNLLTRDVGRVFFGRDLQCAQCHNHPLIDDYLMTDYQGMLAIFSAGYEVKIKQGDQEISCYAERSGSDLEFESVFVKGTKHLTGARVLGGEELVEPSFLPGDEYTVAPADKTLSVPKYSRRLQLAEQATSGQNRAFNENMANRLWSMLMGRGLVPAPDLHHSSNPPANVQLMKFLGEQLAASGFNMRSFLKEIALTRSYQRAWEVPPQIEEDSQRAGELAAQLESQLQALTAARQASDTELDAALEQFHAAEATVIPAATELNAARNKYSEAGKKVAEAAKAVADAQGQVTAKQGIANPLAEAATKAQEAAGKLPEDQELAAAAAKFVERSTQLQNEVAALQKAVEEKVAAHAATVAAQDAVRPEVEAAIAKVQPLRDAMRLAEKTVIAARMKAESATLAENHHRQRLASVQLLASVKPQQDQLMQQQQLIATRTQELEATRKSVQDYVPTVAAAEQQLVAANTAMTAAAEALAKVDTEHTRRSQVAGKVTTALQTTVIAQQALPDDALLLDAVAKLKERSEALALDLTNHQQELDTAAQLLNGTKQQVADAKTTLDMTLAEQTRRQQGVQAAESQLAMAGQLADLQQLKLNETLSGLATAWSRDLVLSDLQGLSPEQLCWSIFQVTGVYDRYRQAEIAELDKTSPLSDEAKADPAQVAARERDIEQRTYDKLKGNLGVFITTYGAGAGQPQGEFFATVDQALFAANGGSILSWVAPAGGNVTEKMINAPEPKLAAEELYLAVLSRFPTEQEVADVTGYLAARSDQKPAAAQELVWSLIASSEFRFNH